MKKKLIVTAHDFGLCRAVNDGVDYALNHKNNIITELALLPNTPGSLEAAKLAKQRKISVSLNCNLTTFRPLSAKVPSLVDTHGDFLKVDVENWDFSSIDKYQSADLTAEIAAQYQWFIDHVGAKPAALLSRKSEHGDPKLLLPFVDMAKREEIAIRSPFWRWRENYGAQAYVVQEKVRMSDSVAVGVFDWKGRYGYDLETDIDRFTSEMYKKPGVTELLLFVGFVDEELFKLSTINWQRAQFLSILDNQEIIDKIRGNFELISYSDLLKR